MRKTHKSTDYEFYNGSTLLVYLYVFLIADKRASTWTISANVEVVFNIIIIIVVVTLQDIRHGEYVC